MTAVLGVVVFAGLIATGADPAPIEFAAAHVRLCVLPSEAAAPAREAYASPERAWFGITQREVTVESGPKAEGVPAGATESGFSDQPVTFTAAVAAALLFGAQQVIP